MAKSVKELPEVADLDAEINTKAHNSEIQKKFWAAIDAIDKQYKPRVGFFAGIFKKQEVVDTSVDKFDLTTNHTALEWYNLFIYRANNMGFQGEEAEKVALLMADMCGDFNFSFVQDNEIYNRMKFVWDEVKEMAK